MRLNLHNDPVYQNQFILVEERFNLLFTDQAALLSLVGAGLTFMRASQGEAKVNLLKAGYFSEELLQAMICGGASYKMGPVNYIWRRLVDREIVMRATGHMPGAFVDHHLVVPLLLEHLCAGTLPNIFAPPSALLERYAGALVAVDVTTSSGTDTRGTGFLARPAPDRPPLLFTCKHNVDPDEGIAIRAITTASGVVLPYGEPRCHPGEDVATVSIRGNMPDGPALNFRTDLEVFDEVFTLGFPLVPCATSHAVGHRGEVNGFARLYLGGSDIVLISNLVSPGNSGGPVLDRDGFCVGMSIKWLEGEWDGETARFSAAMPASLLQPWGRGEVVQSPMS